MSTAVENAPSVDSASRRPRVTAAKRRQYGAAYALVLPFFVIFLAMIVVLAVKPNGLFGSIE